MKNEKLNAAKTKLKKVGVIAGVTALSMLPIKGKAQTQKTQDLEKEKISVVLDTLRLGMDVRNISSKDKPLNFYSLPWLFESNSELTMNVFSEGPFAQPKSFDKDGAFVVYPKELVIKESQNSYSYNTDKLYDKYFSIAKKAFPVPVGQELTIEAGSVYSAISWKNVDGGLCYLIINNENDKFIYIGYGSENTSFILHENHKTKSERLKYSMEYSKSDSRGSRSDIKYFLKSDGSGFEVDNIPGNLTQTKTNVIPDKSIVR